MASKQVRKLESTTQNEVLEIEMAVRDRNGKKIDAEYATKDELDTASETLGGEIDANVTAISGLTSRMGTAEGTITSHGTSISGLDTRLDSAEEDISDHDDRLETLETFQTNTESALTTINSDINDLEGSFDEIERVANGAHNTFVIDTHKETQSNAQPFGVGNERFSEEYESGGYGEVFLNYTGDVPLEMAIFSNVTCPKGSLSDAYVATHPNYVADYVLFIPEGLTDAQKATIASRIPSKFANSNVQLVELKIGDDIYVKELTVPDRWLSSIDLDDGFLGFSPLETKAPNLSSITSRLSACESTNSTQSTNIGNLQSSLQTLQSTVSGKMDSKTIDSEPTSGNTDHLISSAAVYSALQDMQSSLALTSTVLGNVTIND